jgi:hypothetical protein
MHFCVGQKQKSHTQNGVSFTKTATAPRGSIITTMIVFVTTRHCRHHHHHLARTSKMMKVMTAMTRTRRDNDNTLNNKPMTMPMTAENAMTCRSITTIAVVMTRHCRHRRHRPAPTSTAMTAMVTTRMDENNNDTQQDDDDNYENDPNDPWYQYRYNYVVLRWSSKYSIVILVIRTSSKIQKVCYSIIVAVQ